LTQFSRRHLFTLTAALSCCACFKPVSALSKNLNENAGCALIGNDSKLLDKGKISSVSTSSVEFRDLAHSTGNREWDVAYDKALKRISDVFVVKPEFAFYDDADGPNAWAQDAAPPKIYFGKKLFSTLLEIDSSGISIIQVSAHEFGHIHQYATGIYPDLKRGQQTSKHVELHADYLSGYYLGLLKSDHPEASFLKAGKKIYDFGDYGYNNPMHHGTPDERVASADAGFRLSFLEKRDFSFASRAGVDYVSDK
jgi:hypothetical protein